MIMYIGAALTVDSMYYVNGQFLVTEVCMSNYDLSLNCMNFYEGFYKESEPYYYLMLISLNLLYDGVGWQLYI